MFNFKKNIVNISIFLWTLPVLVFSINPSFNDLSWAVLIPFVFVSIFSIFNHKILLYNTPLVLLLTPLSFKFNFDSIGLAHIWVLFNIINIVFRCDQLLISLKHLDVKLILLSFIIVLSSFIYNEHVELLLPGLLNFIAVIIIFLSTRISIKNVQDFDDIIKSLIYSGFLVSILMIFAFYNDMNLNGFGKALSYESSVLQFSKASFFYNNIFYITGSCLIFCSMKMYLLKSKSEKGLYSIVILTTLLAFIMYQNKTAILALTFIMIIYLLFLLKSANIKIIFIISIVGFLSIGFILYFIDTNPAITRNFNFSSIEARFVIYSNFYEVMISDLKLFFFGMGPESALRIPIENNDIIRELKTGDADSSGINKVEGTIDSGLLSFAFEYGFIFVFFFHVTGIYMIWFIFKKFFFNKISLKENILFKSSKARATSFLCFLIFIYMCATLQVVGVTKVSWLIAQILALWPIAYGFKNYRQ